MLWGGKPYQSTIFCETANLDCKYNMTIHYAKYQESERKYMARAAFEDVFNEYIYRQKIKLIVKTINFSAS